MGIFRMKKRFVPLLRTLLTGSCELLSTISAGEPQKRLNLNSRRIGGYAISSHHEENLVEDALAIALGRRKLAEGLLHHSDRVSQYTSSTYQAVLVQFHIQVSMSRKGDCSDNAMKESFYELIEDQVFASTDLSESF
jgi:putative transposase